MKNKQTRISNEQLKLLSNAHRVQIITLLSNEELTAKQLAEKLGQSPGSIHYHVKKLYDGGLIELVRTNTINGIVEKYYRSISNGSWFNADDLNASDPLLENDGNSDDVTKLFLRLVLSSEEKEEFLVEMKNLLESWINRPTRITDKKKEFAVGVKMVSAESREGESLNEGSTNI
ncbi:ArsR/SmtB family transcription factor [Sutcliffiella rhizosphaerae]|uniref:HTH arsR-type domain-containing protein n=1 Tax=Sutcliffiella rhizosphaerae TaxID=2880967 RepID=A0ABM8YKQ9_9BACI|nr:winged helix-turn-helix domain-containing protein [Sutcliffiella rhizosphaerae]CAG9620508.1 hypothetical protein BACCIP111883_01277 [Sutcliffiella rhizosphaerae]